MDRKRLDEHAHTIRHLQKTYTPGATPTPGAIASVILSLTDILLDLINAQLVAGEHAAAVAEMIKRPGEQRMTLGSEVEQSGPRVIKTGSIGAERASWCRKNVRDKVGIKTGLPCGLPIGHEGDCVPVAPDARD